MATDEMVNESRGGEEVDEEVHAGMQETARGARRRRVPRQHCGVTRGVERWARRRAGSWTSRISGCTYRRTATPLSSMGRCGDRRGSCDGLRSQILNPTGVTARQLTRHATQPAFRLN